jgi:hypothetical protein
VFVVVAVNAQKLPVTAVWRVVVVVVILVVNCQLPKALSLELPAAMTADPGKKFERPFSIGVLPIPLKLCCLCYIYIGAIFFIQTHGNYLLFHMKLRQNVIVGGVSVFVVAG